MAEPVSALPSRVVWGVAALLQAVADAIAARFAVCTVRGEISGFSRAGSGHCYFSLKDADGGAVLLRCAMFRRSAGLLNFAPADGQLVELRGRLGVYEARGELQFIVESMQRAGSGGLYEQFLKLKARLESEGLFDAARKRKLPLYPRRIGVVTSLGAAALHDVLSALARRSPQVEVLLYPSLVQGAEAPAALCAALATAAARHEVDLLIVCRGGGSLEDLWAFNDERVVRAIAASPLPVLCGVGHETDMTLADFAADLRAPTPTAAAELAAPEASACLDTLAAIAALMQRRVQQLIDRRAQQLDQATLRLARPGALLGRRQRELDGLSQRLSRTIGHVGPLGQARLDQQSQRLRRSVRVSTERQRLRLDQLQARLRALDPAQVLARGYAWLLDERGEAVVSVGQLEVDAPVQAVLADGRVEARVTGLVATPTRAAGPS